MDFIDDLNESWNLRFEEIGETGDSVFMLQDIDNDVRHRFYPEDVLNFMDFLSCIRSHPNLDLMRDINESYMFKYYGLRYEEMYVTLLVLKDIDNDKEYNFYPDDIKKIEIFLNRLKEFGVIK